MFTVAMCPTVDLFIYTLYLVLSLISYALTLSQPSSEWLEGGRKLYGLRSIQ